MPGGKAARLSSMFALCSPTPIYHFSGIEVYVQKRLAAGVTEASVYAGDWRRGSESNRRIKVLQTSPLPLGYRAPAQSTSAPDGIRLRSTSKLEKNLERETGFEPATSTLARSHSTTELLPLNLKIIPHLSLAPPNPAACRITGVLRPRPVRARFSLLPGQALRSENCGPALRVRARFSPGPRPRSSSVPEASN
jgi:hypothetical protein